MIPNNIALTTDFWALAFRFPAAPLAYAAHNQRQLSDASWKFVAARDLWCASSTPPASSGLSMPSSMATTNNTSGGTASFAFLHKQLDITNYYNRMRLHRAIGYVAPLDRREGPGRAGSEAGGSPAATAASASGSFPGILGCNPGR